MTAAEVDGEIADIIVSIRVQLDVIESAAYSFRDTPRSERPYSGYTTTDVLEGLDTSALKIERLLTARKYINAHNKTDMFSLPRRTSPVTPTPDIAQQALSLTTLLHTRVNTVDNAHAELTTQVETLRHTLTVLTDRLNTLERQLVALEQVFLETSGDEGDETVRGRNGWLSWLM